MIAWHDGLDPVRLPVSCGGREHELTWSAGELSAGAHPDARRERALAALGADPAPCLRILDAWDRHLDDLDVLVVASRGPNDPVRTFDAGTHPGHVGMHGYAALSQVSVAYASSVRIIGGHHGGFPPPAAVSFSYGGDDGDTQRGDLDLLIRLGAGLPHRLAATVIGIWAERRTHESDALDRALPALDAALYGRLRPTLRDWLGRDVNLELEMRPADATPSIARDVARVRAELPFEWLRDVWVPGFAVILDRFCVASRRTAPGTWVLTTVGRDLTDSVEVTVSR